MTHEPSEGEVPYKDDMSAGELFSSQRSGGQRSPFATIESGVPGRRATPKNDIGSSVEMKKKGDKRAEDMVLTGSGESFGLEGIRNSMKRRDVIEDNFLDGVDEESAEEGEILPDLLRR
jgi:hypothetical protein